MKPIEFLGSARAALKAFPIAARRAAGFQLERVQRGMQPLNWKPMKSEGMKSQRFASVWDGIENAENAANLKLRADVAHQLIEELRRKRLTQTRAAELLGVSQPRVSDLMRGHLQLFSLDTLVAMATRAGLRVKVSVSRPRAA